MVADKSIGETMREVENESEVTPESTQEESTASSQEQGSQDQNQDQDNGVSELDKDAEFQKAAQDLQKEMGGKISFGQSKRFKEIYRKMRDTERKMQELQEQNETLSSKELSDEELTEIARNKGYSLTKAQMQQVQQDKQEKLIDELESLYQNATPEEREWWSKHDKAVFSKFEKSLEEKYGQRDAVMLEMITDNILEKSEKGARKLIADINEKYGLKLDYDKEIDPEIVKMIKGLKLAPDQFKKEILNGRINLIALTKEYLAKNGIELGRKISAKETQELMTKKKAANVETTSQPSGNPMSDDNKSLREIMDEEMKSNGVSSFV